MKSKNPDMGMVEVSQSLVMLLQKQIIQERQKLATEEASSKKAKPKPAKSKKATTGKKAGGAQGGSGGSGGGGGAGGGGAGTTGKKGGGGGRKAKRVMGALEKDIIATAISNLDGEPLSRAIEIIKKDTNENVSSTIPISSILLHSFSPMVVASVYYTVRLTTLERNRRTIPASSN